MNRRLDFCLLVIVVLFLTACVSNPKGHNLPISVQSDPLGAYVLLQIHNPNATNNKDWIFIGNTPVTFTREFHKGVFDQGHSVSIKLVKGGYFSQTKEWSGESLQKEKEEKGKVFWNPKLVRQ